MSAEHTLLRLTETPSTACVTDSPGFQQTNYKENSVRKLWKRYLPVFSNKMLVFVNFRAICLWLTFSKIYPYVLFLLNPILTSNINLYSQCHVISTILT